ncbi:hypothetical protein C8J57DRAFT_1214218 [Mycena rebaudengoi]|nr:hypothetical protein C8J57DRAFT_1214218 [Mycena rebaudengoi]
MRVSGAIARPLGGGAGARTHEDTEPMLERRWVEMRLGRAKGAEPVLGRMQKERPAACYDATKRSEEEREPEQGGENGGYGGGESERRPAPYALAVPKKAKSKPCAPAVSAA